MLAEERELSLEIRQQDDLQIASEVESHRSVKSKLSNQSSCPTGKLKPLKSELSGLKKDENPFKVRGKEDLFAFRDEERKKKQEDRQLQKKLKVHEKTYGIDDRLKFRQVALLKDSDDEGDSVQDHSLVVKEDPEFVIGATKGRLIEKETLSDYIAKKREMFLVQYSLGVKKEEMRKLEEISAAEEKKLELAEQYLEEDAAIFDEFLKENDKNANEAVKKAENESKERMKLVSDVKSLTGQLMQIKSEISKYEEQLEEYKTYKKFLDRIVPEDIRKQREDAVAERKERKRKLKEEKEKKLEASTARSEKSEVQSVSSRRGSVSRRKSIESTKAPKKPTELSLEEKLEAYSSDDSEMDLYFKDPQELLTIFTELEESNLSLIQTCQETEESVDELKQIKEKTEQKMKRDTEQLMEHIAKLEKSINEENEKIQELEEKKHIFMSLKDKDPNDLLEPLDEKVQEVYRKTVSDTEAKMSTLDMLVRIESQLEQLFESIDQMPPEKVELAQKRKDKDRREQLRKEMAKRQEEAVEESRRKALERAKAPPKKHEGRRLMARSEPPQRQKEDSNLSEQRNNDEEFRYFFT